MTFVNSEFVKVIEMSRDLDCCNLKRIRILLLRSYQKTTTCHEYWFRSTNEFDLAQLWSSKMIKTYNKYFITQFFVYIGCILLVLQTRKIITYMRRKTV